MRAHKGMTVLHNPFVVLVEVAMFVVEMPRNPPRSCLPTRNTISVMACWFSQGMTEPGSGEHTVLGIPLQETIGDGFSRGDSNSFPAY